METNIQELIPISEHDGKQAVNAWLLHAFLESKQQFTDWIKDRIQKYDLVENQDFEVF
jgi:anti-repressor protein